MFWNAQFALIKANRVGTPRWEQIEAPRQDQAFQNREHFCKVIFYSRNVHLVENYEVYARHCIQKNKFFWGLLFHYET